MNWSKHNQYAALIPPKDAPTMPVRAEIVLLPGPEPSFSSEKFNFDKERPG